MASGSLHSPKPHLIYIIEQVQNVFRKSVIACNENKVQLIYCYLKQAALPSDS